MNCSASWSHTNMRRHALGIIIIMAIVVDVNRVTRCHSTPTLGLHGRGGAFAMGGLPDDFRSAARPGLKSPRWVDAEADLNGREPAPSVLGGRFFLKWGLPCPGFSPNPSSCDGYQPMSVACYQ
ncbi:hypothetical protein N7510_000070 [Penicillium lagena]|uniref:uncharacterized protein n=1 Tax=Penicillium lagena TaxID=94218 RepID=UPI0025414198|nr:uncharacterized protein N7510_000070 [Penicillium lagena]KAJ5623761.1 hypothetical protein N7510_000070 [Penicillium lagena]